MIVVIQCAATKRPDAGFFRSGDGKPIVFVADPACAPSALYSYARPDDLADARDTWRQQLVEYNSTPANNPFGLLPAWKLYANKTYEMLGNFVGIENLYILSAGWGLLAADFLTPQYDITFSSAAEPYKRRRKDDSYADYQMINESSAGPVLFLGGKDYVGLFCELSHHLETDRLVYFNSAVAPYAHGCRTRRFKTSTRTNWHYECARALIEGRIGP